MAMEIFKARMTELTECRNNQLIVAGCWYRWWSMRIYSSLTTRYVQVSSIYKFYLLVRISPLDKNTPYSSKSNLMGNRFAYP